MAGTILKDESPFICTVDSLHLSDTCSSCLEHKKGLITCSKCRVLRYCDKNCERKDRIFHEVECRLLSKMFPEIPEQGVRHFLRFLIALKSKPNECAYNGRTSNSLVSHLLDLSSNRNDLLHFINAQQIILENLKENDLPRNLISLENYGKVRINTTDVIDFHREYIALAVYLGLSALQHSCKPNSFIVFERNKAILKTINAGISVYSDELTISYIEPFHLKKYRQSALFTKYYFQCNCSACEGLEQEYLAESLLCKKCQTGYLPFNSSLRDLRPCVVCSNSDPTLPFELIIKLMEKIHHVHVRVHENDEEMLKSDYAFKVHRYGEQNLSPFNLPLANFGLRLAAVALEKRWIHTGVELLRKSIRCYQTIDPESYIAISALYRSLSALMFKKNPKLAVPYLQEAVRLEEIMCGKDHRITAFFREKLRLALSDQIYENIWGTF